MSIFDRFRDRRVEVPELQVSGNKARLNQSPNEDAEEPPAQKPEDDPRNFSLPGKTWAAFVS